MSRGYIIMLRHLSHHCPYHPSVSHYPTCGTFETEQRGNKTEAREETEIGSNARNELRNQKSITTTLTTFQV